MKKLKVSSDLSLPLEAITQRISFLGKTGSGKTYSSGVLAEEALRAGQQVIILDPKGDWWGLRAALVRVVHAAFPNAVDKEELARQAGVSPTSSAYTNNLGALRSAGIVEYVEGGVRCQDWMFLMEQVKR